MACSLAQSPAPQAQRHRRPHQRHHRSRTRDPELQRPPGDAGVRPVMRTHDEPTTKNQSNTALRTTQALVHGEVVDGARLCAYRSGDRRGRNPRSSPAMRHAACGIQDCRPADLQFSATTPFAGTRLLYRLGHIGCDGPASGAAILTPARSASGSPQPTHPSAQLRLSPPVEGGRSHPEVYQ